MSQQAMILVVPEICEAGEHAALLGTHMCTEAMPMGFTFMPYKPHQMVERWNFLSGVVEAHFGSQLIKGEQSRWHRP